MAARIGNKTAEKWDYDTTMKVLDRMEHYGTCQDIPLFKQALARSSLYPQLWSYLKRKWRDDDEIMTRMFKIEMEFENKLVDAALRNQFHPGVAMLIMRTKYGYTEKKKELFYEDFEEEIEVKVEEPAPEPPSVTVEPAINNGTFTLQTKQYIGSHYMVIDSRRETIQHGPITSDTQQIQMKLTRPGTHYIRMIGRRSSKHDIPFTVRIPQPVAAQ